MLSNAKWTEADLEALLGQPESIRREFKSGRLVEENPESKWILALSEEVSALANTEGGELFVGIEEDRKTRPRVALALDGVPASLAPERLQQLIEGNVSPYLPGIRVQRVRLSKFSDKVVFIIQVPQGNTAYQAKDGRYYGRSEYEAKFLPDHEVRLRMSRGRTTRGLVSLRILKVELSAEKEEKLRSQYKAQYEHLLKTKPDESLEAHGNNERITNSVVEGFAMVLPKTKFCDFGWKAGDFALKGVDGKPYALADVRGSKGTLVAFICNHCPYVNASIDRIVAEANALREIGIGTIAIMPNDAEAYPEDSFDNMKAFAAEHGFTFPYVIDETQEVARTYGAQCTPDFFGFNAQDELQYRGRLDASRITPVANARRDLFAAMKQVSQTGHGPAEQIPSMGCSIKWKD